jgi:hypothetical protein
MLTSAGVPRHGLQYTAAFPAYIALASQIYAAASALGIHTLKPEQEEAISQLLIVTLSGVQDSPGICSYAPHTQGSVNHPLSEFFHQ